MRVPQKVVDFINSKNFKTIRSIVIKQEEDLKEIEIFSINMQYLYF